MPDTEQVLGDKALQLPFEGKQPERIRHAGAPLAHPLGGGFLREVKIANQAGVAVRLFNRVEAFPL